MVNTTPIYGLPYAQDTDARGAGAEAMQELAEATEAELARIDTATAIHYATAWNPAEGTVLAANTPAPLAYEGYEVDGPFGYNGSDTFTYTGPARAFVIGAGYVAVFPTPDDENLAILELRRNGVSVLSTGQDGSRRAACTLAVPTLLNTGDTIALVAQVSDPATAHDAYLRVMAL